MVRIVSTYFLNSSCREVIQSDSGDGVNYDGIDLTLEEQEAKWCWQQRRKAKKKDQPQKVVSGRSVLRKS